MNFKNYLTTAFRWQKGRQKSGYDKMLVLTGIFPVPFDMYFLRFPEGSEISEHVDKVKKGKHYRINIILKKAKAGGIFYCNHSIWESDRIKYFRPDIAMHAVSKVEKGTRIVFSIGWIKSN